METLLCGCRPIPFDSMSKAPLAARAAFPEDGSVPLSHQRSRPAMPLRYSLACLLLAAAVSHAQPALVPQDHNLDVKEHYTKYEYRIPMRDGAKLFTAVYVPKNGEKYPILLQRTPYTVNPYGVDKYRGDLGPSSRLAKE